MKNKYYKIEKGQENKEEIIITKLPRLYKYQSFNDYSIKGLMDDEVWLTSPQFFNDPYDMICTFDEKKIRKSINASVKNMDIEVKKITYLNKTDKEIEYIIFNDMLNNIQMRKLYYVGCYSEDPKNEIMWSHYADCGKGFAVEYDSHDLVEACKKTNEISIEAFNQLSYIKVNYNEISKFFPESIAPVLYTSKKLDITNDFEKSILKYIEILEKSINFTNPIVEYNNLIIEQAKESIKNIKDNNSDFYKMLIFKKPGWKYEKEWRIWAYNLGALMNFSSHFKLYPKVFPKRIILGENVSGYNEKLMLNICKEKNIPVYKIKNLITRGKCKLDYYELKEK